MHRTLGIGERERRPLSLARLGAALVAVLVGEAAGRTTFTTIANSPSGTVYSVASSYAAPTSVGGALRLQVDAPPEAQAMLIVSRGPQYATTAQELSIEELASAVVVPVALDEHGDLDLIAAAPAEIPLELLRESRLRFRVAFHVPGIAVPLISDPIAVVPPTSSAIDTDTSSLLAASPTSDSSATSTLTQPSSSPLTSAATSSSPTTTTVGTTSTSTVATTSLASSVATSDSENQTDSASAPPSASKAGVSPTSSVSVPIPSNLAVRFVTQFTLVSATHDQPSPIQGSGH